MEHHKGKQESKVKQDKLDKLDKLERKVFRELPGTHGAGYVGRLQKACRHRQRSISTNRRVGVGWCVDRHQQTGAMLSRVTIHLPMWLTSLPEQCPATPCRATGLHHGNSPAPAVRLGRVLMSHSPTFLRYKTATYIRVKAPATLWRRHRCLTPPRPAPTTVAHNQNSAGVSVTDTDAIVMPAVNSPGLIVSENIARLWYGVQNGGDLYFAPNDIYRHIQFGGSITTS